MPFFQVTKGQDAYVNYVTVVEASSAKEAWEQANSARFDGQWVPTGDVPEFDDHVVYEEDVLQIEASTLDEAHGLATDNLAGKPHRLLGIERDMILAALNLWINVVNDGGAYITPELLDIATNGEKHELMDDTAIDDLCERLNG